MPTPEFVLKLRERVGHDLIPLIGVTGVVRDAEGRLLLGLRSDTRDWALPSGIVEPGEEPAQALSREITEETSTLARVDGLVAVSTTPVLTHPNGDLASYLDLTFACTYLSGTAHPGDDENLAVGWFAPGDLPPLRESSHERLARALDFDGRTWFAR